MASTSDAPPSRERERERGRKKERAQGLAIVLVLQVLMNRSLLDELFELLPRRGFVRSFVKLPRLARRPIGFGPHNSKGLLPRVAQIDLIGC